MLTWSSSQAAQVSGSSEAWQTTARDLAWAAVRPWASPLPSLSLWDKTEWALSTVLAFLALEGGPGAEGEGELWCWE